MHAQERRKHQRLNGASIQTAVKRKGLFYFGAYKAAQAIDFSRFGVGIESSEKFRLGDELLLSFNKQNEHIEHIVGFVCHVQESETGYCYGIQFDFSANKHMRSEAVEKTLTRIEKLLESTSDHAFKSPPHPPIIKDASASRPDAPL